jgi:hypothetical protein
MPDNLSGTADEIRLKDQIFETGFFIGGLPPKATL